MQSQRNKQKRLCPTKTIALIWLLTEKTRKTTHRNLEKISIYPKSISMVIENHDIYEK